ncbi:hypothetical protein TPHA_0D00120 [Tetrapisispora phaffii CBS 4417]|uniref:L-type lectin-like domain-containing protein n=1 Tax=Tetrapisispora phaffii (strain ATCC 24235 / CBS 4417 / NBRC 1672 / NRRL Y-8282 / UCD 70-5) TaxID=1071381 RepID=G8BS35_TETPH|nr:hypothetical protein TPHA_0D00120 [Tetrapisispora phaffii CBS 4417]CCE62656.1 hypothetical protein TPHA_0D00120 [Tetrapisispora phaffii CBS 4417]
MILRILSQLFLFINISRVLCHPVGNTDALKLSPEYSLPDLLKADSIPSHWSAEDSVKLAEGRIVLTPEKKTKGSLWLKNVYNLDHSFTIEWTFRSVSFFGKSKGGLSFWFTDSSKEKNKNLFNGPSTFEGLQLLVDNSSPVGSALNALLNDGSINFAEKNLYDSSFASCLLSYQDSSVPTSLRLTYNADDNNLLKLQLDNKVCFQTRKIKIPKGSYSIGVTANNADNVESFEILNMKLYNGVISDSMIPNKKSMPQPKYLTKIIDKDSGKEKLIESSKLELESNQISNYELYKKLDKVEGKILANDIANLEEKLLSIVKIQKELAENVDQLSRVVANQPSNGQNKNDLENNDSFKDFLAMNEKLEKVINEQEKLRETSKHQVHNGPQLDEILRKLFIWLLPLIAIMLVMAYHTFRIRQEIVKTKLL